MTLVVTRTVHERGSGNSFSQEYYVFNDDATDLDATTAEQAGLLQFQADFLGGGLADDHNSERVSDHSWRVTGIVNAKSPGTLDAPDPVGPEEGGTKRTRFNFQARSRLVKNSYRTVSTSVSPLWGLLEFEAKVDSPFGGLVNLSYGLNTSYGFQLNAPSPTFTEEYTFKNNRITNSYIQKVAKLCSNGTVNDDVFLGYDKGEILLVSCQGGKIADDTWQLSFGFAFAPNLAPVVIDDDVNFFVESKRGHDHLWTYDFPFLKKIPSIGASIEFKTPMFALVEEVWTYGDLDELFIAPKPNQEF